MKILDTTSLLDLLHGKPAIKKILAEKELLVTTQIDMFEVLSQFPGDPQVESLFDSITVLPLDQRAVHQAAKFGNLPHSIALKVGIAMSRNITTIITNKPADFKRIRTIKIEDY
jgi:predicted nucleic acid-binding protein